MPEQGAPREGSGDQLAVWTSLSFGCRGSPGFCGPVASAGPTSDFRFLLHLAQFPGTVSRHRRLSGEVQYGGTSPLFTADPAAVRCDVCLGGAEHPSSSRQSGLGVLTKPRRLRTLIHKDSHRIWDRDTGAGVGGARNRVAQGRQHLSRVWCPLGRPAHATRGQGVARRPPWPRGAHAGEGGQGGWQSVRSRAESAALGPGSGRRLPGTQQPLGTCCEGGITHRPAQREVPWDHSLSGGGELSGMSWDSRRGRVTPLSWASDPSP